MRYLRASTVFLALILLSELAEAKRVEGRFTALTETERLVFVHEYGSFDVRVLGVDAPEPGQPFAVEARDFVRDFAVGREGSIRFRTRTPDGVMVSRVYVGEEDLALALVRAGLAWRLPSARYRPPAKGMTDALTAAEQEARAARRGIWSLDSPVPPWTHRGEAAPSDGAAPDGFSEGVEGTLDRNTSQKTGADSECSSARNPANLQQAFVLCNTSSAGLFAARSTDGGSTWIYPDPADKTIADGDAGQGTSACCDPSLAWDSFGNLFLSYLTNSPFRVAVLLSTDGGATFTQLPDVSANNSDQQTTVVADIAGGGHVVWTVWNQSGTMTARGAAVTALGAVGAWSAPQAAPGASSCSFGDIAVSPGGAVVQVCGQITGDEPSQLRVNTDADGLGVNGFAAVVVAATTNVGAFDSIPPQASRTVDPEAGLAYDRNPASPFFGRLYLVYTDETVDENHDTEIMIRFSDNNGATWSAAARVNDDATTRSQFLPRVFADAETGNLAACWHDARNSATNTAMELFCTSRSETAVKFEPSRKLSDGASTSNQSGVEFGDYAGLDATGLRGLPVWADTSNSTGDNPNGTSSFDAYVDRFDVPLFADRFENGNTAAWNVLFVGP